MRETFAIFDEDGTFRVSGYTSEKDASDDTFDRPEGCFVARACACPEPVPARVCVVCGPLDDNDDWTYTDAQ